MEAVEVIEAALMEHIGAYEEWLNDEDDDTPTPIDSVFVLAALRAAVGGGPVVILEDGTLATLLLNYHEVGTYVTVDSYVVVPVGGEA